MSKNKWDIKVMCSKSHDNFYEIFDMITDENKEEFVFGVIGTKDDKIDKLELNYEQVVTHIEVFEGMLDGSLKFPIQYNETCFYMEDVIIDKEDIKLIRSELKRFLELYDYPTPQYRKFPQYDN